MENPLITLSRAFQQGPIALCCVHAKKRSRMYVLWCFEMQPKMFFFQVSSLFLADLKCQQLHCFSRHIFSFNNAVSDSNKIHPSILVGKCILGYVM